MNLSTTSGRGRGAKALDRRAGEGGRVAPLPPLDVAVGPWRFDPLTTEERFELITGQKRPAGVDANVDGEGEGNYVSGELQLMVYRASAMKPKGEPDERLQRDRFEVTHVHHMDHAREYVIVIDKVERRFVFIGEDGCHPHCGTNEFIYDNSHGSGPGLMGHLSELNTLGSLLETARRRFVQFSLGLNWWKTS